MNRSWQSFAMLGLILLLVAGLACSDGSNGMLESSPLMASFGLDGTILMEEGLGVGASPSEIELDPCDPETPVDEASGELLAETMLAALVLDAELMALPGVEVTFAASAGELASMGMPVLTDETGMAFDVLTVKESDAGVITVTAATVDFEETIEIPVTLLEKPPVTLSVNPTTLWPPNHTMHEVTVQIEGLDCYPETTPTLVSAVSSEPDNGTGDGDTENDIQQAELGSDDRALLLRAERAGDGDGRIYTVTYELILDGAAPELMSVEVTVPHDQGG